MSAAQHAQAGKLWMNPQCGKLELAVCEFDQALDQWTADDGDALRFACLQNRGLCYEKMEALEDAERDLSAALEIESNSPAVYASRGGVLHSLGRKKAALTDFRRYLELDPEDSLGLHRFARSHIELCGLDVPLGVAEASPLLDSEASEPTLQPPRPRRGRSERSRADGPRVALMQGGSELIRVSSEVSTRWYKQAALCGMVAVATIAALVTFALV
jgi:tetratricopeptide (TPR) repeat protein